MTMVITHNQAPRFYLAGQPVKSPRSLVQVEVGEVAIPKLLATKLAPPPLRPDLLPRPRLTRQLDAALAGALTLIAAPAGSGKTTLLAAWRSQAGTRSWVGGDRGGIPTPNTQHPTPAARTAWLSIQPHDDDLTTFLRYLVAALRTAVPEIGAPTLALLPMAASIPELLIPLVNELATLEYPLTLILDDYHLLRDPAIQEAVSFLLEHRPAGLHVMIATRDEPRLPLARLRARRQICELRAADLRFTGDEATALLNDILGLGLDAEAVAALETRTEGWATGLQLAALTLQASSNWGSGEAATSARTAAWAGNNRFVVDFLRSEVIDQLPCHLRSFLLRVAVLDRFCGPLCDALLGIALDVPGCEQGHAGQGAYSRLLIDEIERANLFLVPLDEERHWYRLHRLFAEVLRSQLATGASAAELAELHRRAAAWYSRQGQADAATQHRLAARELELHPSIQEAKSLAAPLPVEALSPRELEVLRLIAAGKLNAEIARELVVAVSTVKAHINNIFAKLEVSHRIEAVVRARQLGLLGAGS